jgi:hypothetical protein
MSGRLLHSVPRIIARALIARAVGVEPLTRGNSNTAFPIYAPDEPPTPDNVITVLGTQGVSKGRLMTNGEVQLKHGIQVRVRAATDRLGSNKANEVFYTLTQVISKDSVTLDGTTYTIHCLSNVLEPFHLGKQKPTDKLDIWTINALATVRQAA